MRLKAERDSDQVEAALSALSNGARAGANLLDLAIKAARARASVGEMSLALEKVFGRHRAQTRALSAFINGRPA